MYGYFSIFRAALQLPRRRIVGKWSAESIPGRLEAPCRAENRLRSNKKTSRRRAPAAGR